MDMNLLIILFIYFISVARLQLSGGDFGKWAKNMIGGGGRDDESGKGRTKSAHASSVLYSYLLFHSFSHTHHPPLLPPSSLQTPFLFESSSGF